MVIAVKVSQYLISYGAEILELNGDQVILNERRKILTVLTLPEAEVAEHLEVEVSGKVPLKCTNPHPIELPEGKGMPYYAALDSC